MLTKEEYKAKRKARIAKEAINHKANIAHIVASATPDCSEFIKDDAPEPF